MLTVAFMLLLLSSPVFAQTTIRARTESGKEVILSSDGTWKYVEELKASPSANAKHSKPPTAKKLFKPSRGNFGIWYDDSKWKQLPTSVEEGEKTQFSLLQGDGYVTVVAEEIPIPTSAFKEVALENAKTLDPSINIVAEEKRIVNGIEVLCLTMEGTIRQIPFKFYGYYYGGKDGAIQIVAFTSQNVFNKYQQEFTNFLNGLEVYQ